MFRTTRKSRHDFTLIELLITIAIIAILAGLLLPALNSAKSKGIAISCMNNLKGVGVLFNTYADDFGDFFPSPMAPNGDGISGTGSAWSDGLNWGGRLLQYRGKGSSGYKTFSCPLLPYTGMVGGIYENGQIYGMNPNLTASWGICRPGKGQITFALRLAAQPLAAREYVVVHEYCHFLVPNHSPAFWKEVGRILPDWKDRRALLP